MRWASLPTTAARRGCDIASSAVRTSGSAPILIMFGSIAQRAVAPAIASPRSDPTSGRAVFTGATMPSAPSIWLNPAALALGLDAGGKEIYVGLTSVVEQTRIQRKTLDLATGNLTRGPSVDDTRVGPGGMLALIWHPNSGLTLGVDARLPGPELFPKDHEELRYHTLGGGQRD